MSAPGASGCVWPAKPTAITRRQAQARNMTVRKALRPCAAIISFRYGEIAEEAAVQIEHAGAAQQVAAACPKANGRHRRKSAGIEVRLTDAVPAQDSHLGKDSGPYPGPSHVCIFSQNSGRIRCHYN